MQHRLLTVASLITVAGTVSACNATDSIYSQSPWGPAYVRRNYPEYSAPWGQRHLETPRYAFGEPGAVPVDTTIIDTIAPERRQEVYSDVDIDPVPTYPEVNAAATSEPPVATAPMPSVSSHSSYIGGQPPNAVQASPAGTFTAPQRASSYAGTWNARIGASSCKVQLSSVPSLDLYKASTQGCSHEAMRNVNGWSFRENQVILFSRGQLVARLSGAEAALDGTMSKLGSDIHMSR